MCTVCRQISSQNVILTNILVKDRITSKQLKDILLNDENYTNIVQTNDFNVTRLGKSVLLLLFSFSLEQSIVTKILS